MIKDGSPSQAPLASGLDAFKVIALGTDGIFVSKGAKVGLASGGAEYVRKIPEDFAAELRWAMNLPGATESMTITPILIRRRIFQRNNENINSILTFYIFVILYIHVHD